MAQAELADASALMAACRNGHAEVVESLLKAGARTEVRDKVRGAPATLTLAQTPLPSVCLTPVSLVLHAGDTQALKTAMMVAAENGRLECAKALLQAGADANAVDYVSHAFPCTC